MESSSRATSRGDDSARSLAERACALYEAGLSTRRIAAALHIGRRAVERFLHEANVAVAPRGAGRKRPQTRHEDAEDLAESLRELYQQQGLTRRQVSDKLGLSEGLVRTRLSELGIPTRSRGQCNRQDRREPDVKALVTNYVEHELSAEVTGERLGVSRRIVLRAAHDHGLPVRPGAAAPPTAEPVKLIEALYADPLVAATLARHAVPQVPPGGPIWRRFPETVPLTAEFVNELYVDCGVSITHIELLTGQPATAVRRQLHEAKTPLRKAGGRSPFLRRSRRLGRGPAIRYG